MPVPSTVVPPASASSDSSQSSEGDLIGPKPPDPLSFNAPPPAYSTSLETGGPTNGLTRNSLSSKDLKKTSELIAEAKMKGIGIVPSRSSSPTVDSPTSSSASLLRKSLSKVSSLRLPDVKALFPTWPPPRSTPSLPAASNNVAVPPPSFFDSSGPVVEEELEPLGRGSGPPSPSIPQVKRGSGARVSD